jgi:Domain of unknown function (DUF4389)
VADVELSASSKPRRYVALLLIYALALIQFIALPFAREMKPDQLGVRMGKSLSDWLLQASRFLCFASDEKPFPWKAWPSAD